MDIDVVMKEIIYDIRGFVVICHIGGKQSFLLFTKKGYCRGGDLHDEEQLFVILKGKIKFTIKESGIERELILMEKDTYKVKPKYPHMLSALEDCVVLEISLGDKERNTSLYAPYRSIVESKNKEMRS